MADELSLAQLARLIQQYGPAQAPQADQAAFLRSEKDVRPYDDTWQRHTFFPIGVNGYNNTPPGRSYGPAQPDRDTFPSLSMPGMVHDTIEGFKHFGDMIRGKSDVTYIDQDGRERPTPEAMGSVNALVGATMVGGSAATKPKGSAGVFAGREAKTFNPMLQRSAEYLESRGNSPQDIHRSTGLVRRDDGNWRFEIDDSASRIKDVLGRTPRFEQSPSAPKQGILGRLLGIEPEPAPQVVQKEIPLPPVQGVQVAKGVPLSNVLEHDALYDAYPFLKNMKVTVRSGDAVPDEINRTGYLASKQTPAGGMSYRMAVTGRTPEDVKSALLHELQHYVQKKEGWASGGSPEGYMLGSSAGSGLTRYNGLFPNSLGEYSVYDWERILNENLRGGTEGRTIGKGGPEIEKQVWNSVRDGIEKRLKVGTNYEKLPGEAEANLTQQRADMTPAERRSKFPALAPDTLSKTDVYPTLSKAYEAARASLANTERQRHEFYKPRSIGDNMTFEGQTLPGTVEDAWTAKYLNPDGTPKASINLNDHNKTFFLRGNVSELEKLTPQERASFVDAIENHVRKNNGMLSIDTHGMSDGLASWFHKHRPYTTAGDPRAHVSDIQSELSKQYGKNVTVTQGNGYGEDWTANIQSRFGRFGKPTTEYIDDVSKYMPRQNIPAGVDNALVQAFPDAFKVDRPDRTLYSNSSKEGGTAGVLSIQDKIKNMEALSGHVYGLPRDARRPLTDTLDLVSSPSNSYVNYDVVPKGKDAYGARGDSQSVGSFVVKPSQRIDALGVESTNSRLSPDYQRQGIGTKVYDAIGEDFADFGGINPSPRNQLSPAAIEFWRKRLGHDAFSNADSKTGTAGVLGSRELDKLGYYSHALEQSKLLPNKAAHTVFPLSPEVRKRILDEGLPLFSNGSSAGAIPSASPSDRDAITRILERLNLN